MCIQVSCYKQNLLTSTCYFLRLKHPNFSASQLAHFGAGIKRARYTLLDFSQDREFIMSNPCSSHDSTITSSLISALASTSRGFPIGTINAHVTTEITC